LPVALALDALSFTQLAVVAFLEGVCATLFRIAETPAVRQLVPPEQLPAAIAQNQARVYGAFLAGPPAGGALFGVARALPFIADCASYLASALMLLSIHTPFQEPRERSAGGLLVEARQGMLWLWRTPFLWMSEVLIAGSNFVSNGLTLVLIVVAHERGTRSAVIGLMLALVAAGGLLGAMVAPRLVRLVSPRLIVVGYSWVGVAVLFALVPTPPTLALGAIFALWVFFGPLWDAIVIGYRLATIPDEVQGRVESIAGVISLGTAALGPLAAGLLIDQIGATSTLAVFGGWMLILAVAGTLSKSLRLPTQQSTASVLS
jgi:predicted MFS family arabinose efflux permease